MAIIKTCVKKKKRPSSGRPSTGNKNTESTNNHRQNHHGKITSQKEKQNRYNTSKEEVQKDRASERRD